MADEVPLTLLPFSIIPYMLSTVTVSCNRSLFNLQDQDCEPTDKR